MTFNFFWTNNCVILIYIPSHELNLNITTTSEQDGKAFTIIALSCTVI